MHTSLSDTNDQHDPPSIHYTDDTITLWCGDALQTLRQLPDHSVNCCVTSPPYYGLRDYGTAGQYGLEASPAEYVETMRQVFAEVRRVLAVDGTLWLNLGDGYVTGPTGSRVSSGLEGRSNGETTPQGFGAKSGGGLAGKNLLGMPWRVAFALQDDDSADIYELREDAPDEVRSAIYLGTCRTRIPRLDAHITANTHASGATPTETNTARPGKPGTKRTPTEYASTAASTTSCTASKKSFAAFEETPAGTECCGSQHSSTTEVNSQHALAAANGTSHSCASTTSTAAATNTVESCGCETSAPGNICGERGTRPDTEFSAITATPPTASTGRARTKTRQPRLPRSQIRPDLLHYFRLVRPERWILRNSIVWHKPNAMPESVTDRLSNRHESLFLFARSPKYWFDLDPIREPLAHPEALDGTRVFGGKNKGCEGGVGATARRRGNNIYGVTDMPEQVNMAPTGARHTRASERGRNPGDMWSISTQPFAAAHFAVMPPALAERCVLAGCRPGGIVLDPFCGSGTTGMVAGRHGRRFVGVDLSATYLDLALETRLAQATMPFEAAS